MIVLRGPSPGRAGREFAAPPPSGRLFPVIGFRFASISATLVAVAVLVAVAATFSTVTATAGQMFPLPIETLTRESQLVVHAVVTRLVCREDVQGRIYTEIFMTPMDVWKGGALLEPGTGTLRVVQSGGILGTRGVRVRPQARYRPGETVVAFLARNPAGEWVTFGLAQGKFNVEANTETGAQLVSNPFHGGASGNTTDRPAPMTDDAARPGVSLSLSALKREVQEVVN